MPKRAEFRRIAAIIADMYAETTKPEACQDGSTEQRLALARIDTIYGFALRMSDHYASENGAFDRQRFASACGLDRERSQKLASR